MSRTRFFTSFQLKGNIDLHNGIFFLIYQFTIQKQVYLAFQAKEAAFEHHLAANNFLNDNEFFFILIDFEFLVISDMILEEICYVEDTISTLLDETVVA